MPHTKSAAKNLRKSEKRKAHNRVVKRDVKIQVKALETAITGGGDSVAELTKTYSAVDKAAGKGVIHKNKAARIKSRLMKAVAKAAAAKK